MGSVTSAMEKWETKDLLQIPPKNKDCTNLTRCRKAKPLQNSQEAF